MRYELFYLVAASKEAELDSIKKAAENIILEEGGVFEEKEVTEKRKLAYEVKHETHGFYVARRFEIENGEKIQSITRKLNLYTGILRSLISKASELPELQTKEERIGAANLKKASVPKEKAAASAPSPEKSSSPVDKIASSDKKDPEDIDKKLEEILNI